MKPHFQQKTIFTITTKKENRRLAVISFNDSTEGFSDSEDFQMHITRIIENLGVRISEDTRIDSQTELLFFNTEKEDYEIHSQHFSSEPIGNLELYFHGIYEYFESFSERQNKESLCDDLEEILEMGDELNDAISISEEVENIFATPDEDEDNPFRNANADELEEEKEQAKPDSQLAHPTSEEAMISKELGYTSEMTVEPEPREPAPFNQKLHRLTANVLLACAGLSAVFMTIGIGAMALHQVKTLF